MLKKIITVLATMTFLFTFNQIVYADDIVDMNEWKFYLVDCNDEYKICRYYSKLDENKYAFCIEPGEYFNKKEIYYKNNYYDEYIFNVVKAYDQYGLALDKENDNYSYYAACQIMIWEYLSNEEFTFINDYFSYIKNIEDYIDNMNSPIFMNIYEENIIESNVGEVVTIQEDYSDYSIQADEGIEIVSNEDDGLSFKVNKLEPEYKYIELDPIYDPKEYCFKYSSENSQDLYFFEGTYDEPKPVFLTSLALNNELEYIDIYYSKVDTDGNYIEDARFSVYEINSVEANEEILFINTNTDINLYEALLGDYSNYNNLSIVLSERYNIYLNDAIINTNELGYFPYKIYDDSTLIKEGICYVCNDIEQTNGSYNLVNVLSVFKGYSEAKSTNTISGLLKNKTYYLCESEPAKGYQYTNNPCVLVDTSSYDGQIFEFINSQRTYTLKLMKQSPYEVLLDGAKFKITYLDGDEYKDVYLTTGYLNIARINDYKYLIYRHENELDASIAEFDSAVYSSKVDKQGKYYYYQSNDPTINTSLLNNEYVTVTSGGFCIENMPYSSKLRIEEIEAPKGFMITEPVYEISPNIAYSEITFRNFRVNEFEILPKKKFKMVKTCIEE